MPGSGGGQTTTTQQVNTGPWQNQQPFLNNMFGEAQRIYDKGAPQFYPNTSVAQFSQPQWDALGQIKGMGAQSPLIPSANNLADKTMSGGFLDPSSNPWLKNTFNAGAEDVTRAYQTATAPQTAAGFSGMGRYGSPGYRLASESNQMALGKTLNNLATDVYGGNYQRERDRQLSTMGGVGNLIQSSFLQPTALMNAGGMMRERDQALINEDKSRWDYNQNQEWQNLARFYQMIQGNYGQSGTTTSTQPGKDPMGMILGGLLSGASVAGGLGWKPFGV